MGQSLLPIRLQNTWLLLGAEHVEEILGPLQCLRLPRAKDSVPGIVSWRARAVPVVDLAAFVPGVSFIGASEPRNRTVIVSAETSTLALPVDGASEVESIELDAARPLHAVTCHIAAAEIDLRGRLMMLLDWDALLAKLFEERSAGGSEDA